MKYKGCNIIFHYYLEEPMKLSRLIDILNNHQTTQSMHGIVYERTTKSMLSSITANEWHQILKLARLHLQQEDAPVNAPASTQYIAPDTAAPNGHDLVMPERPDDPDDEEDELKPIDILINRMNNFEVDQKIHNKTTDMNIERAFDRIANIHKRLDEMDKKIATLHENQMDTPSAKTISYVGSEVARLQKCVEEFRNDMRKVYYPLNESGLFFEIKSKLAGIEYNNKQLNLNIREVNKRLDDHNL